MATSRLFQANEAFKAAKEHPRIDAKGELTFKASTGSHAYSHVYTADNVISFFFKQGNRLPRIDKSICFEQSTFKFGRRSDATHACWHQSEADVNTQHAHIIKGDFELVTPKEFQCVIDQIRLDDFNNEHCLDGKTDCALSSQDTKELMRQYNKYYERAKAGDKTNECSKEIIKLKKELNTAVMDCIKLYANAFILSLTNTLLDRYVKPYLISSQAMTPGNAAIAVDLAKYTLVTTTGGSKFIIIFDVISERLLKALLTQTGLNTNITESILRQLSVIASVIKSPFIVKDMIMAGGAGITGEIAAMHLIHQLPKLRAEPAIEPAEPAQVVAEPHPTLRRRGSV